MNRIQRIDWTILRALRHTLRCRALDFLMPKITALGNGGAVWIAAAGALLLSRTYRAYGIALAAALAVGALAGNLCLKPLIARPRPCWLEPVALPIRVPTDFSFPSGHTLASVIGAYVLTAANRGFGWPAVLRAVLIGFSRLYLFVHFPSDVLAAAVIGTGLGAAAVQLARSCLPLAG